METSVEVEGSEAVRRKGSELHLGDLSIAIGAVGTGNRRNANGAVGSSAQLITIPYRESTCQQFPFCSGAKDGTAVK